ncbi:hypothetical protein [Gimesia chilikensis]|nr:hypothetical protein [Gimesia chilikensis]
MSLLYNDQGHRAVTFGFHLEIAGGHGSGTPPCYVPDLRKAIVYWDAG